MKEHRLGNFLAMVLIAIVAFNVLARIDVKTVAVVAVCFIAICAVGVVALISAGGNAHRSYDAEPQAYQLGKEKTPLSV